MLQFVAAIFLSKTIGFFFLERQYCKCFCSCFQNLLDLNFNSKSVSIMCTFYFHFALPLFQPLSRNRVYLDTQHLRSTFKSFQHFYCFIFKSELPLIWPEESKHPNTSATPSSLESNSCKYHIPTCCRQCETTC